jgi:hypothetical protein
VFNNSSSGSSREVVEVARLVVVMAMEGIDSFLCFIFMNLMLLWTMRCDGQYCLKLVQIWINMFEFVVLSIFYFYKVVVLLFEFRPD